MPRVIRHRYRRRCETTDRTRHPRVLRQLLQRRGEAADPPRDLAERPWDDLDFLGWRDPGAPDRAYLIAQHGDDDQIVGVTLRLASQQRGFLHRNMCSLCLTTHPGNGVSLMTGRRAGEAGRRGDSVGSYICTDLACSLYVRGLRSPDAGGGPRETLSVEEKVERTRGKLTAFLDRLL
ncbi:FBP domain-containing protein [Dactylosporangium cerinum]